MRKIFSCLSILALGLFITLQAQAQSNVSIGTLTCTGGEGVGMVLGSNKVFSCTFSPSDWKPEENYRATITKIGLDIGVTGTTIMVWTVLAATQALSPGMLTGTYTGAALDAALGVGGGAKMLVGGSAQSIVLQPLSVQSQTGLNLAVGVASMTLALKESH